MEQEELIRDIQSSGLPVLHACRAVHISRSTYYRWKKAPTRAVRVKAPAWNALMAEQRRQVLDLSEARPEWPPRQIAWHLTDQGQFISESSAYRILKAAGKIPRRPDEPQRAGPEYTEKPQHVHDQWQSDFTDFFIPSWGWYHDGGVLDDRSRFLLHHDLRPNEKSDDVIELFDHAVSFARRTHGYAARRIVFDHGKCFEANTTKDYLSVVNIRPIHARSHHPQTVGKLERLHRTMKERVNLHVYDDPWKLSDAIDRFYHFYNYERYHEALGNVTPADVYFGRAEVIVKRRRGIRSRTMEERRRRYEAWKKQQNILTSQDEKRTLTLGLNQERSVWTEGPSIVSLP